MTSRYLHISGSDRARCDVSRALRKLWPAFAAVAPLLMLRDAVAPTWLAVFQLLSCAILIAAFLLRRRIPVAACASLVTLCLYACGVGAIGVVDPFTAVALGMALLFATFTFVTLVETEAMISQCPSNLSASDLGAAMASRRSVIDGECRQPVEPRAPSIERNLETAAYALSHDLRAPLRAIEGFARAVAEDWGDRVPPAAARDLNEIRAGVERMQRMIARWLSFMRGKRPIERERVDLSALAESVLAELRIAEPRRAVTARLEPDLEVVGDPVLLRELLQNLLGNAWKFTRRRQAAAIEFGALQQGGQTVYFVRDNGVGFASDEATHLFEPFARLHAPTDYEGSGIGLTIARNIAVAHGGDIWAQSRCDAGATFSFTLTPGARESLALSRSNRSLFDFRRDRE